MKTACCILGAGYSHVGGFPLVKDLFNTKVVIMSEAARRRLEAVREDYNQWKSKNSSKDPEEYLTDFYKSFLRHPPVQWAWVVELVATVLATPRGADSEINISPRYGTRITRPLRCSEHTEFWDVIFKNCSDIAVITANYDLLVERCLRHRPMKRPKSPGVYYGGLPRPQMLKGTALPFTVTNPQRIVELTGKIPIFKLHGSLNWTIKDNRIILYQDLRPAFRHGNDAAIIPPVLEKEIPRWLQPVWLGAIEVLSQSDIWIVCGYSLPEYDHAVRDLLRKAAKQLRVSNIFILDLQSNSLKHRWEEIAPSAHVVALSGLPAGIAELADYLSAGLA